ncbi:NADPH-dependent FMN reductase [Halobacillus litoralis]|uniref:FMN-dependent NADH-azoreductase n=1 Tax=Halobacillus litoralis TaxID=45668 RepID=A0A410MJ80_9BACI|nr:NADPH-dependent FMN reductase [Halobacillus litoralis]QAS54736.1 FMN-dependent NADH-azoreductase [Halobacillus litoralis]
MNVLLFCGSPREASITRGMAALVKEELLNQDVNVFYFDAFENQLPLFDGEKSNNKEVKSLAEAANKADGFFFCTPEYHNGISGALKNALDYLNKNHFRNKPTVITSSAGAGKGGVNSLNNLRLVLRGVHSLVLPEQLVCDSAYFNEYGELTDEEIKKELNRMVDNLVEQLSEKNNTVISTN